MRLINIRETVECCCNRQTVAIGSRIFEIREKRHCRRCFMHDVAGSSTSYRIFISKVYQYLTRSRSANRMLIIIENENLSFDWVENRASSMTSFSMAEPELMRQRPTRAKPRRAARGSLTTAKQNCTRTDQINWSLKKASKIKFSVLWRWFSYEHPLSRLRWPIHFHSDNEECVMTKGNAASAFFRIVNCDVPR